MGIRLVGNKQLKTGDRFMLSAISWTKHCSSENISVIYWYCLIWWRCRWLWNTSMNVRLWIKK